MEHHKCVHRALMISAISIITATTTTQAVPVVLNNFVTPYTQDFDSLAGSGPSLALPTGWALVESGTGANTTYAAGTGSSTTGDTLSLGANGSLERALGGLQTGSLVPSFGIVLENRTGQDITSLLVNFTGEQWRLGALNRMDRLDFQYSLDASSLTSGTWLDFDSLDFISPTQTGTVGALNGNSSVNQQFLSASISGLVLGSGATVWFRWTDLNASGSDDALAIDDFSVQAAGFVPASVADGGSALAMLGVAMLWLIPFRLVGRQKVVAL